MRVFILQNEEDRRLVAVRCPCCGGRILDAAYGAAVMIGKGVPGEKPEYIIKCWRCKQRLGIIQSGS